MFEPFDLSALPDEQRLPAIWGFPPLVPMVAFPPAIGHPRSVAAVEAGRAAGLLAWICKRDPKGEGSDNLLPVGLVCQVGSSFEDGAGTPRTILQAVARCTWERFDDDPAADHAYVTVRPVSVDAVRDPALEPLAIGLIQQVLTSDDDDVTSLLGRATKDVGALADEAIFQLFLTRVPDDAMFELHQDLDPVRRFHAVCGLAEVEPVAPVEHPALVDARAQAQAMLAGDTVPDMGALMNDFFPQVLDDEGNLSPAMVVALGRVIALAGA